jgi:hypothetical protein
LETTSKFIVCYISERCCGHVRVSCCCVSGCESLRGVATGD